MTQWLNGGWIAGWMGLIFHFPPLSFESSEDTKIKKGDGSNGEQDPRNRINGTKLCAKVENNERKDRKEVSEWEG